MTGIQLCKRIVPGDCSDVPDVLSNLMVTVVGWSTDNWLVVDDTSVATSLELLTDCTPSKLCSTSCARYLKLHRSLLARHFTTVANTALSPQQLQPSRSDGGASQAPCAVLTLLEDFW